MGKNINVTKLDNDALKISGGRVYGGRKPHLKHPIKIKPEFLIKHSRLPGEGSAEPQPVLEE